VFSYDIDADVGLSTEVGPIPVHVLRSFTAAPVRRKNEEERGAGRAQEVRTSPA
jgi:hypothetical protein